LYLKHLELCPPCDCRRERKFYLHFHCRFAENLTHCSLQQSPQNSLTKGASHCPSFVPEQTGGMLIPNGSRRELSMEVRNLMPNQVCLSLIFLLAYSLTNILTYSSTGLFPVHSRSRGCQAASSGSCARQSDYMQRNRGKFHTSGSSPNSLFNFRFEILLSLY